jgi:hypothetical protein
MPLDGAVVPRSTRTFNSVFSSSTPQRPGISVPSYGSRPLGPTTYHPKMPAWHNDPSRMTSTFLSKVPNRTVTGAPLTCEIDYLESPEKSTLATLTSGPSSHGHSWPDALEPRELVRDKAHDDFCQIDVGTLSSAVTHSSRRYASSFQSASKRMSSLSDEQTSPVLGPGAYDTAKASIVVHEPKRANYTFKSQTQGSLFDSHANQPPDAIQSIQTAILLRHWTSKGSAFSTRERFPRQRPKWKD